MQAIILAGGKGTRLRPYTTCMPKPLVPIGDVPILEVVLKQLAHAGFKEVVITVNHLAELIMAFFKDGEKLGIKIRYSIEDIPLGTAGPLSIIEDLEDDFIVMNGDVLTTLDYNAFFKSHLSLKNDITIATYKKEVKIDLGVLKTEDSRFVDYIEKPTYQYDVSMGIYAMKKTVLAEIPKNTHYDLPDLVLAANKKNKKIHCHKGDHYWLDIGRAEDYELANAVFKERKSEFLPEK
jgi:NDP-mannose synthase